MQHTHIPMVAPPVVTTSPPTPRAPRQRHKSSPPSITLPNDKSTPHSLPSPVREYHNKISQHLLNLIQATPAIPPNSTSNPSSSTSSKFNSNSTRRSSSVDMYSAPATLSPVMTIPEEEEDKTSSIPTMPAPVTPPEFTARPIILEDITSVLPKRTAIESREEEQKNAWATDGHRVYKAPVGFSLSLGERSRRGSAASSRVGTGMGNAVSQVSVSMMGESTLSRSMLTSQNMTRENSGSVGDCRDAAGGTSVTSTVEKDEDYEARRNARFAKKQGQLRTRVEKWSQSVSDANPTGSQIMVPEIFPFLPSPSLLITRIRHGAITEPDIDLAVRLSTLNALLSEKVLAGPKPVARCTFTPKPLLRPMERGNCAGEGLFDDMEPLIRVKSVVKIVDDDGMPTPRAGTSMVFLSQ